MVPEPSGRVVDVPRGEAPKKCSTFSERSQHVLWDLWSTLIVTPDFSSDLERGAVPRSIADEKSGVTVLVIELHWSQDSEHFRSPAVFLGILPRDPTRTWKLPIPP